MANQGMFQRVHKIITTHPELHHQQWWEESNTEINNRCGTTRCIAGWAVWLVARDLGLLARKRHEVDEEILEAVARHYDVRIDSADQGYSYRVLGATILDLCRDEAEFLFHDMNNVRVVCRVKSFAETGEDISDEEFFRLD